MLSVGDSFSVRPGRVDDADTATISDLLMTGGGTVGEQTIHYELRLERKGRYCCLESLTGRQICGLIEVGILSTPRGA